MYKQCFKTYLTVEMTLEYKQFKGNCLLKSSTGISLFFNKLFYFK